MRKERTTLKVSAIVANEGQLTWLPANPRQWTQTDIDRTRNSILEDPDFLEDRPLLVVPIPDGKTWLVFAGNLRREGAKSGKVKEVPCVIYYPETEEDHLTIKRRAMKDNGAFGAWDYDTLANEWGDLPLVDWGVPAWEPEKAQGGIDIDGLFDPNKEAPHKEGEEVLTIIVEVPKCMEDKTEDIRQAIVVTLEEWPDCKVL